MNRSFLASVLLATATLACSGAVETYKIDTGHSSVGFKVRHFFTPVPGSFTRFEGTITLDREAWEKSSVEATIEATSIDTANDRRDGDLRGGNFFSVEAFPKLTFKSTSWKKTGEDTFDVTGDLTIKGVTKPVTLAVKLLGIGPGARGAVLSGWEATTRIDRRDFGVSGAQAAVGNEVEVLITIEGVRQG
jgi:polyisoprenoid-binding protein YceI